MSIHDFGRLPDGTPIAEIRLANAAGSRCSILMSGPFSPDELRQSLGQNDQGLLRERLALARE